ncbi:CU044_5270 family protein [Streptomyces marincola]|uniref:CU044_5270 family protein n=1 Tax=Streptomyces marincola TaxID=2878388 RepID=UPI001CF1E200|nr:CU044_5270 family protein [Streptomyces marincola]UCM88087.1 CU044_5270 family protein [Streptomyces marincola]
MGVSEDGRALSAGADPADGLVVDEERARADPETVAACEVPGTAGRRGRRVGVVPAVAAGMAATAGVAALVLLPEAGGDAGRAHAVTPPPLRYVSAAADRSASEVLGEIADRAAALPEPTGKAVGTRYRVWSLSTQVASGSVTSEVVATDVRNEWHPDGSLTQIQETPEGAETFTDAPSAYAQPAPAGDEAFAAWLEAAHGRPTGDIMALQAAAHDLVTQQALGPDQRAAFLRMLAGTEGLEYDGEVTDRAGRDGQAFSAVSSSSGLPTRYTFIIDPATGDVLGQEDTLTESAGELDVPIPSVIGYEVYLPPVLES